MTVKNFFFSFIFSVPFYCMSCEETFDCELEQSFDQVKVRFFDKETLVETRYKFDQISAVGTDSIFFEGDSLSLYRLNLNPSAKNIKFLFSAGLDEFELNINYDVQVNVISDLCGIDIVYELVLVQLDNTTFDSAALVSPVIELSNSHNIEIYR